MPEALLDLILWIKELEYCGTKPEIHQTTSKYGKRLTEMQFLNFLSMLVFHAVYFFRYAAGGSDMRRNIGAVNKELTRWSE